MFDFLYKLSAFAAKDAASNSGCDEVPIFLYPLLGCHHQMCRNGLDAVCHWGDPGKVRGVILVEVFLYIGAPNLYENTLYGLDAWY